MAVSETELEAIATAYYNCGNTFMNLKDEYINIDNAIRNLRTEQQSTNSNISEMIFEKAIAYLKKLKT